MPMEKSNPIPQAAHYSPYRVQVLERTLAILDLLAGQDRGATLSELSRTLDLNKTTAFRLLNVLGRHGVFEKRAESQRYFLGLKLFQYGSKVNQPARAAS